MARLLAQITGNGSHTDDKWIFANRQQVEFDKTEHRAEIDRLGALITPETKEIWTHTDLSDWCERHARNGARVIMIDPITALKAGKEPWLQDFELAMRLKDIASRYECSIIITTHPRGTAREPSLAAMSGGVAWSRFSHSVLWLEGFPCMTDEKLADGGLVVKVNRKMRILKCRHGKGSNAIIGMTFSDDVNFHEVGALQPDNKKSKGSKLVERVKKSDAQREREADESARWMDRQC